MPNRETHFVFAVIFLIIIYFILKQFNLMDYLFYAGILIIGSVLPDIIEPAKNYTHRNYFHSKRFLKILYYSLIPTLLVGIFFHNFLYVFFFILVYISHLWLDSTTKMGLPD